MVNWNLLIFPNIKVILDDGIDKASNVQVSPTGDRVAYEYKGKIYITELVENSPNRIEITHGESPQWWVHPQTRTEYLLIQRGDGSKLGDGHGIFTQELDSESRPVGEPKFFLEDPMANAGRSPDGKFLANEDEEHERCWRGHGFYEIDKPMAVESAEIRYWVYVSDEGWYSNGKNPYKAYCNGSMSPAEPGHPRYSAMLHMGSGHTEVYIRKPDNYQDLPLVKNLDAPEDCPDKTRQDVTPPILTIEAPRYSVESASDKAWGYSDWSTHPDFMSATGGGGTSSRKNKNGYVVNLSVPPGERNFGVQVTKGGVAQPDLWVESGPSSLNWYQNKLELQRELRKSINSGQVQLRDFAGRALPYFQDGASGMAIIVPKENLENGQSILIPEMP